MIHNAYNDDFGVNFQLPPPTSPLSSAFSQLSSSPPQLDPSTLALLGSFYEERSAAEQQFQELADRAAAQLSLDDEDKELEMISVDEFRALFGEDWQLSQFWYSTAFATRLAKFVRRFCTEDSRVAYLCCPTGFVAFQHTNPLRESRLLEFDRRFALLASKHFVHYDLDEPDKLPAELLGSVDIAIVDPPFLNEITNRNLAKTLSLILHPTRGRLLLITSSSVTTAPDIYAHPRLGALRLTNLDVEHANNLANDFVCWSSWEEATSRIPSLSTVEESMVPRGGGGGRGERVGTVRGVGARTDWGL